MTDPWHHPAQLREGFVFAATLLAILLAHEMGHIIHWDFVVMTIAATIARVEWGLVALVFMIWTNLSDVLFRYHHVPSIAQPFIALLFLAIVTRWVLFSDELLGTLVPEPRLFARISIFKGW